ncbi:glycosyltransferase family 4 protein [Inquilinus sp. KBS0705]|nr:glycosyltransferase family 4 protein [Inquilinus sp. KBS0705]
MKIGYDAKRAFLNNTGLGNYSRWLIKLLASSYPQNNFYLYTPKIRPGKWPDLLRSIPNIKTVFPKIALLTSWWRTNGIVNNIKRDGINIYHGLSHELPLDIKSSGAKTVVTVHDVIFMRYPQYFGVISRAIYKFKLTNACKTADKIIAISTKTRQDLIELLNVDADKIQVIYQGCDAAFKQQYSEGIKSSVSVKYNLPAGYLLSVGTVEERKNLALLVKALPLLSTSIKLVVVGRQTAYYKRINQLINQLDLQQRVVFLTDVPFTDLPVIYQLASVFVYPSRYEGFGIPILEALNSGVPVVASTGSCLEEAGGPDSSYNSPDDHKALAANINRILADDALKANMISKGLKFALNFADDKLAARYMHLYTTLHNA